MVQAVRVKRGGEAVALDAPVQEVEVGRPMNFHQSADIPLPEQAQVPMHLNPDGTPYTVQGNEPRKVYNQPVCIGYAHMGMVHERFMQCMLMMAKADPAVRTMIGESSCNLPLNRNIIMQRFLDMDAALGEWLLFLDTDITFPAYTASAMVKVAVETGADIVAVPYQLTNGCSTFGTARADGGYATQGAFTWDRAYLIDAAGTGCMLISRKLIARMKEAYVDREPWPFCGYDRIMIDGKPEYESDDYSLCHRAKDIGAKIVGYTGIVLEHLKTSPLVFKGLEQLTARGQ